MRRRQWLLVFFSFPPAKATELDSGISFLPFPRAVGLVREAMKLFSSDSVFIDSPLSAEGAPRRKGPSTHSVVETLCRAAALRCPLSALHPPPSLHAF